MSKAKAVVSITVQVRYEGDQPISTYDTLATEELIITIPYIDSKSLVLPKPIEALTTLAWNNHRSLVREALSELEAKRAEAKKLAAWNGNAVGTLWEDGEDDSDESEKSVVLLEE